MNKLRLAMVVVLSCIASPALADHGPGWHHTGPVARVSNLGWGIFVAGSNPSGETCNNYNSYYGTLYRDANDPGHKTFVAMALTASLTNKGLACHITVKDSLGNCKMTTCSIE